MNSLIIRLVAAHRMLNREIRREAARPRPDEMRLRQLKKQRLAVKDRLFKHLRSISEMRQISRLLTGRPQLQLQRF